MRNIFLIVQREYTTRVRKKSFIIMSVLGPLIMVALMIVPLWLSGVSKNDHDIVVLDHSGKLQRAFTDLGGISFRYIEDRSRKLEAAYFPEADAILVIPPDFMEMSHPEVQLHGSRQTSYMDSVTVQLFLAKAHASRQAYVPGVKVRTIIDESLLEGKSSEIKELTSYILVVLIYFFIFLYGIQVMKGVIEEKTNRIVEVIVSTVKPFQLMAGKIIGLFLVGFTQYIIWLVLGYLIGTGLYAYFDLGRLMSPEVVSSSQNLPQVMQAHNLLVELSSLNFPLIIGCFLFYFMGGYLIYGALFAAIGSASDVDADTQQFTFPITMPLLLAFVMMQQVVAQPDSAVAKWLSMIPLTSPVSMMARIPVKAGDPGFAAELMLSMVLLAGGFVFFTWIASRIYRIGILMYGKKVGFKELGKWIFYKS